MNALSQSAKHVAIAASILTSCAIPAHANVYGFAESRITDFELFVGGPGFLSFNAGSNFNREITATSASYSRSFAPTSHSDSSAIVIPPFDNPFLGRPISDAAQAVSGPGPFPLDNQFIVSAGLSGGMTGSRGDALTLPVGYFNVAEVNVVGRSRGAASASNTETTEWTVVGNVTLSFFIDISTSLIADAVDPGSTGSADLSTLIRAHSIGGLSSDFTWLPNNCFENSGITSQNASPVPISHPLTRGGTCSEFSPLFTLVGGDVVQFTLDPRSSVEAVPAVPEPGSFSLFCVGLIGLASLLIRARFGHKDARSLSVQPR
jgi:hypothetical protein